MCIRDSFQAKNIRITQVTTAAEEMAVSAGGASDPAVKAAMDKQIEAWKATAERLKSEPKTGRDELAEQAADAVKERDLYMAKYHHYELSSAAFQVGIVLASAAVITGMIGLALSLIHISGYDASQKTLRIDIDIELDRAVLLRRRRKPLAQVGREIEITRRFDQQAEAMPAAHQRERRFGGAEDSHVVVGRRLSLIHI